MVSGDAMNGKQVSKGNVTKACTETYTYKKHEDKCHSSAHWCISVQPC